MRNLNVEKDSIQLLVEIKCQTNLYNQTVSFTCWEMREVRGFLVSLRKAKHLNP